MDSIGFFFRILADFVDLERGTGLCGMLVRFYRVVPGFWHHRSDRTKEATVKTTAATNTSATGERWSSASTKRSSRGACSRTSTFCPSDCSRRSAAKNDRRRAPNEPATCSRWCSADPSGLWCCFISDTIRNGNLTTPRSRPPPFFSSRSISGVELTNLWLMRDESIR